jgi:FkbM family methyltransferase
MTFVDAGANEGLYTLFAGRHVGESGRVLAFEPSAREFARMEANIALNGLGNVRPFRMALAQDDGEADLLIADDAHSGQNTLGALPHEGVVEAGRERVAVRRLDRALAEEGMDRVDFIKIDVEGAEAGLLEGASETLRRFRPLLLIEFNDGALRKQGRSSAELLKLLESTEYVVFSFQETTGLPGPPAEGIHEGNLLCVPREKGLPKQWALSLVRTVPA